MKDSGRAKHGANDIDKTHQYPGSGVKATNDGVSLKEGYKVVKPSGNSPQAMAQNTGGKTPGAKSY